MKFTTCLVVATIFASAYSVKIDECSFFCPECVKEEDGSCNIKLRVKEFQGMLEELE